MSIAMTRLDNWVMESGSWENEERRDALPHMTEKQAATSCRHRFGPGGDCYYCPATAEEEGY